MGLMKDLQDAINQAMGLASPPPKHNAFHYNEYGKRERKWLAKKETPKNPRGDRRHQEKPMGFYKRQRQKHDEEMKTQRERARQTQDQQGTHGNPTRGRWGGIW